MDYKKLYINGEWIDSESNKMLGVENPSTKQIFEEVPRANEKDVEKAIFAAKQALLAWKNTSLDERIELIKKLIEKMRNSVEEMTEIVVKELGCGYSYSKNTHIISYINEAENYIKIAKNYNYEVKRNNAVVRREPVGVVACLTPWNFPLEQIVKKVFPSLLIGNTIVLKPSQLTPLTAYKLTQFIDEVGYPKGVFNLITGKGSEIGNILASHKDIDMVSFTGSTEGGKEINRNTVDGVKNIVLEMGGKSAAIILDDADIQMAVKSILDSVYLNSGQTCNAFTRMVAPKSLKNKIEDEIIKQTKNYTFGNPGDKTIDVGPLASQKQFDKVKEYIELGIKEKANLLVGEIPENCDNGYYVGPIVFTDVKNNMTISQEEIFGPVLCVIYYDELKEAIEIANDSIYGLCGAVFGNKEKAKEVANQMETGSVYINNADWDMDAPFGGYKQSGLGREGGIEGFEDLMEIKTIYL